MSKQLQDAYIVAATRTPIGKAPRGFFNKTRPDDLLIAAIAGALIVAMAGGARMFQLNRALKKAKNATD